MAGVQTAAPAAAEIQEVPAAPRVPIVDGGWSLTLMSCVNDLIKGGTDDSDVICLNSAICPCMMEGKIAAVVAYSFAYPPAPAGGLEGTQWENCLVHCFLGGCCQTFAASTVVMLPIAPCFSFAGIPASYMRSAIRNRYNIPGSKASDAITHLCCFSCALAQEYNELKLRIPANNDWKWKVMGFLAEDEVSEF